MAVADTTMILRFADVGVATYASLRIVGDPSRTVTWVIQSAQVRDGLDDLAAALPEPTAGSL